jgi:hypothetical protein
VGVRQASHAREQGIIRHGCDLPKNRPSRATTTQTQLPPRAGTLSAGLVKARLTGARCLCVGGANEWRALRGEEV